MSRWKRDAGVEDIQSNREEDVESELDIRESVLLEAMREALEAGKDDERESGAFTTIELCEMLGWSDRRVRTVLRQLMARGLLTVTRIPHVDLSKRATNVPGYKIGTGPLGELMNGRESINE